MGTVHPFAGGGQVVAEKGTHTPGPWHVTEGIDRFYNGEWIRAGNMRTGDLVAVCNDFNQHNRDAEREANARLIAAAPDLLQALTDLLEATNYHAKVELTHKLAGARERAQSAIAKATGEAP